MSLEKFDRTWLESIEYAKISAETFAPPSERKGGRVMIEASANPFIEEGAFHVGARFTVKFYAKGDEEEAPVQAEIDISACGIFNSEEDFDDDDRKLLDSLTEEQEQEFSFRHFSPIESLLVEKVRYLCSELKLSFRVPYQISKRRELRGQNNAPTKR